MRQRCWVELLNDYDFDIPYHPRKANVVANALSRKEKVKPLRVRALNMTVRTNLTSQMRDAQLEVLKEGNIITESLKGLDKKFTIREAGTRYFINRIWVPKFGGLRELRWRVHGEEDSGTVVVDAGGGWRWSGDD
ncbi:uncharacterized protein [Rutidosis leptorrhynchoides]|uniref:uncharacterized protein n=1 Tax=Rutidosis leptorrhynchoides TaxID=125765 RepID=UPI003A99D71E